MIIIFQFLINTYKMENKNTFEYPKITIVNPLTATNLTIPYMYKNYDKIFHYKGVIYPICSITHNFIYF